MHISIYILSIHFSLVTILQSSQPQIILPSFKATRIGKTVSSSTPTEDLQVTSLKACTNECLKTNCKAFSFQAKAPSSSIDRSCQIVKEYHSCNTTDDFLEDDNTFVFYEISPKWNLYEKTPFKVQKPHAAKIIRKPTDWWSYVFERYYKIPKILHENDIVVTDFCLKNGDFSDKESAYFVGMLHDVIMLLRLKIYPTIHGVEIAYRTSISSIVRKLYYDSTTSQGKMIQPGFCYHATIHLARNETIVTLNGVMLAQFPRYFHPKEITILKLDNRAFILTSSTTFYII
ncbi:uncharacterized protein LOC143231559 [Tachypleus tridentatus]|uniref:uncharacterized protein LOC143231559 n=1 Tax=Tachypleus tridentatus TaxID=6853 RepID=UPI003FD43DAF